MILATKLCWCIAHVMCMSKNETISPLPTVATAKVTGWFTVNSDAVLGCMLATGGYKVTLKLLFWLSSVVGLRLVEPDVVEVWYLRSEGVSSSSSSLLRRCLLSAVHPAIGWLAALDDRLWDTFVRMVLGCAWSLVARQPVLWLFCICMNWAELLAGGCMRKWRSSNRVTFFRFWDWKTCLYIYTEQVYIRNFQCSRLIPKSKEGQNSGFYHCSEMSTFYYSIWSKVATFSLSSNYSHWDSVHLPLDHVYCRLPERRWRNPTCFM